MSLNAYCLKLSQAGEIFKTSNQCSNVNLFKSEIISVNVGLSKIKIDVLIAVVLRCFRLNLLIFIRYLCSEVCFLKRWENFKKTLKT